jgi:hypothetical protein
MEEHDLAVLARQSHARGTPCFRQCPDNGPERLGASCIVDNAHPFLEFARLFPRGMLDVLTPEPAHLAAVDSAPAARESPEAARPVALTALQAR